MATTLALLLVLAAMTVMAAAWLQAARPRPVKVRRNLLQEELLAAYIERDRR